MADAQPAQLSPAFARTPEPPYVAVIFSSRRTDGDQGYGETAASIAEKLVQQPGFLGCESARDAGGFGITVSYWSSLQAVADWKADTDHRAAQAQGRQLWYAEYQIRITTVERAYAWTALPTATSGMPTPRG